MIIKVEAISGDRFQITDPKGNREVVAGVKWNRKLASEVLDVLEHVYKYERRKIKFQVV